jgi:hypothetical protein
MRTTMMTAAAIIVAGSFTASALPFGTEITVYDKIGLKLYEDNEIETGQTTPNWDFEGFNLKGSVLNMVGTFNFRDGNHENAYTFRAGDLFLNTDGPANYGTPFYNAYNAANDPDIPKYAPFPDVWGYDYVLDIDWDGAAKTGANAINFNVVKLNAQSILMTAGTGGSQVASSPWRYISGGDVVGSGTLAFQTGLTDAQTGYNGQGDVHKVASIDLGPWPDFLDCGTFFHWANECGNDSGGGEIPCPDGGTTLSLLGLAMLAGESLRRKLKA